MKFRFLNFIFLTVAFGCASSNYRFQSNPSEVEVEIVLKNGTKKSLGKTPVTVVAADVNPNKESMTVNFKKAGLESQSVHVPASLFMKSVEIDMVLEKDARSANDKNTDKIVNDVATDVADVQKFIQSKQYSVAEQRLNKMISENPTIPVFYSLMGNVYYLDKKLDPALTFYKKALDLNPNSGEISRMVQKIESLKLGGTR